MLGREVAWLSVGNGWELASRPREARALWTLTLSVTYTWARTNRLGIWQEKKGPAR
jgi:hypothetical protein